MVVTGGSGFIGSVLVERLLDRGYEVRVVDRHPGGPPGAEMFLGDIREEEVITAALRGADALYHLAAEHEDDVEPTSLYYDVNVEGTRRVAEAAARAGVQRIIFTSTAAVYAPAPIQRDEDTPAEPSNDYGRSKLQAERVLLDWAESDDRSLVIVRPTAVFGKGSKGNVQNLIDSLAANRFLMVGSGKNRKSLAFVDNLAELMVRALDLNVNSSVIVNYADKPDLTMNELVGLVQETLGRPGRPRRIPYWLGLLGGYIFDLLAAATGRKLSISSQRVRKFCADTTLGTKKLEALGFEPLVDIHQGLEETVRATALQSTDP